MMLNAKEQYMANLVRRKGPYLIVKLGDTWTSNSFMIIERVEPGMLFGTLIKHSDINQSDIISNMSVLISCSDVTTMTSAHRDMIKQVLVEVFHR